MELLLREAQAVQPDAQQGAHGAISPCVCPCDVGGPWLLGIRDPQAAIGELRPEALRIRQAASLRLGFSAAHLVRLAGHDLDHLLLAWPDIGAFRLGKRLQWLGRGHVDDLDAIWRQYIGRQSEKPSLTQVQQT